MEDSSSAPARNSPGDNEGRHHKPPNSKTFVGKQHSKSSKTTHYGDKSNKSNVESESSVEDEVFEDDQTAAAAASKAAARAARESSPVFYLDPADWPRTHPLQPSPVPSPLSQPHRWSCRPHFAG